MHFVKPKEDDSAQDLQSAEGSLFLRVKTPARVYQIATSCEHKLYREIKYHMIWWIKLHQYSTLCMSTIYIYSYTFVQSLRALSQFDDASETRPHYFTRPDHVT